MVQSMSLSQLHGDRGRTNLVREDGLILEEALRPIHERVNVFRGWKFRWPFVSVTIFPEVFISIQRSRYSEQG